MKRAISVQRVWLRMAFAVSLLSGVCIFATVFYTSSQAQLRRADAQLIAAVTALHALLGEEFHDRLNDVDSLSADVFEQIVSRNDDLCRRMGLQYLWSMLQLEDGRLVFTTATRTDIHDETSRHAAFFEEHRDPRAFARAVTAEDGTARPSSFDNEWGRGRMVLVPFSDAHGRRYVLGASIELATVYWIVLYGALLGILLGVIIFGLAMGISIRLLRRFYRSLQGINHAARALEAGSLDIEIPDSEIQELQLLGVSLESMRAKTKWRLHKLCHNHAQEMHRSAVLSLMAQGVDLERIYARMIEFLEATEDKAYAAVFLHDAQCGQLKLAASGAMPAEMVAVLQEGIEVGMDGGSSAAAAWRGQSVIVDDIADSPLLKKNAPLRAVAQSAGMGACWSVPVFSSKEDLLGTVSVYARRRDPSDDDSLKNVKWCADMLGMVLERKEMHAQLEQRDLYNQSLLNSIPDAIFVIDAQGYFRDYKSDGFTPLMPPESFLGKHIEEVLPQQICDLTRWAMERVHATGNIAEYDYSVARDGKLEYYTVRMVPFGGDQVIALVRMVTAQKELELELKESRAEAERANEMKSAFLANMSHEVRTPMSGVIGLAHLLLDTPLTRQQRSYLETLLGSAQSLLRLLNDILDISRIEAGKLILESAPFDLIGMLSQCEVTLGVLTGQKDLRLCFDIAADVPRWVVGDSARLRQILTNLIGNAVKFTEQGQITVRAVKETAAEVPDVYRFEVEDTGIGICASKQAQLFERFIQADASITRKFGGSGLGLPIAKELCALMGGQMAFRSESGKGSLFWFTVVLPPAPEDAGEPEVEETCRICGRLVCECIAERALPGSVVEKVPAADGQPTFSGDVLLVEDNPVNQTIAKDTMERLGVQVTVAGSGELALSLLAQRRFDLVFMDLQMPGMDGLQTTRHIRAAQLGQEISAAVAGVDFQRLPIVAMTAHAMESDRRDCLAAGMDDFITKPITPEVLISQLRRWLPVQERKVTNAFDVDRLLDLLGGNPTTFASVLAEFATSSQTHMTELANAVQSGDLAAAYAAGHAIKGATAYLNCRAFEDVLVAFLDACKHEQLAAAQQLLPDLQQAYQPLLTTINSTLDRLDPAGS